jgi:hypothetical protein
VVTELAEQSENIYYALILSRAVPVIAEFMHGGRLNAEGRSSLTRCYDLMKRISRAQVWLRAQQEKIAPDVESIQAYQYTHEALVPRGLLEPGENLGMAADRYAATLQAILNGKTAAAVGEGRLIELQKALAAQAVVFTSKTALASLSRHAESLLPLA